MNEEIRLYMRYHPRWYIVLSRYPEKRGLLVQEYKDEKNQVLVNKLDQVGMIINMMQMMM